MGKRLSPLCQMILTVSSRRHIAKVSWQITFTMKSASDGGLVLGGDVVKPTIEWAWDYGVDDDMRNQIIDKYKTAGENFDKFVEKVKNCLEGTEHFAFPVSPSIPLTSCALVRSRRFRGLFIDLRPVN